MRILNTWIISLYLGGYSRWVIVWHIWKWITAEFQLDTYTCKCKNSIMHKEMAYLHTRVYVWHLGMTNDLSSVKNSSLSSMLKAESCHLSQRSWSELICHLFPVWNEYDNIQVAVAVLKFAYVYFSDKFVFSIEIISLTIRFITTHVKHK